MKLSYDATWQDVMQLLRTQAEMIFILTGVFILLPLLAQALYFAPPVIETFNATAMQTYLAYLKDNFPLVFAMRLLELLGTGAILALLIAPDRPTVGEAISRAARFLPSLLVVDILVQMLWGLGLIALIVPGCYLIGRTTLSQSAMMAEQIGNPIRAIARSLRLTDEAGWRVFGFVAIVGLVTWIGTAAAMTVLGVLGKLLLPEAAAAHVPAVLGAMSTTVMSVVAILVPAGLYRQLLGRSSGM